MKRATLNDFRIPLEGSVPPQVCLYSPACLLIAQNNALLCLKVKGWLKFLAIASLSLQRELRMQFQPVLWLHISD